MANHRHIPVKRTNFRSEPVLPAGVVDDVLIPVVLLALRALFVGEPAILSVEELFMQSIDLKDLLEIMRME
jgi:hypothetical protein